MARLKVPCLCFSNHRELKKLPFSRSEPDAIFPPTDFSIFGFGLSNLGIPSSPEFLSGWNSRNSDQEVIMNRLFASIGWMDKWSNRKRWNALMKLNRILSINSLIVFAGILIIGALGCTKSSLKEIALFRGGKEVAAEKVARSADDAASKSLVWHDSFDAAKAASAESGKPILADFTGSDWCHWCIKLKADVFEKEEFKTWASQNVTLLELDFPNDSVQSPTIKKQNAELAKKYNVRGYPTVLFLTDQGEVLGKLGYEKDPKTWIESAQNMISK